MGINLNVISSDQLIWRAYKYQQEQYKGIFESEIPCEIKHSHCHV